MEQHSQRHQTAVDFDSKLTFFPYGFQYHRAPTPLPEEWDGDLRRISEKGYTHVQYRPQWRWHERVRGDYKWDDLDRLFDLAEMHNLRVVLKPMLETAPDWVFTELEGTRIGFHGIPITLFAHGAYYVGGWWPCFDNPGVVGAATEFVRQLTDRYKSHPALWIYDAWNEPVSRPLGQCQCIHSKKAYRNWLGKEYGSIEKFNEHYGKAWTSFETVEPPVSGADYVEMFLWRKWAANSIAGQVRFVADTIRAADPAAHILVHVGGSLIKQDSICETSNDLLNAKAGVDRYGTSFAVPLRPETVKEHADPELQSSWLRRVDQSYWCHEFYPNHANWCIPPENATLRRLIWAAIAGGAAGFTFWQYRSERVGNETNGFGLMNIDGTPTERTLVADSIAAVLKEKARRLVSAKRVASGIRLLYDHDSDMISRIQKLPGGIHSAAGERGIYDYPYKKAVSSAHALYHFLGLEPDWTVCGDSLDSARLLHVTATEMVNPAMAEWLKAFVEKGGNLIVEFPFACRDERTWVAPVIPSNGLADLLGCVESKRVTARKENIFSIDGCDGHFQAGEWKVSLAPMKNASVIGRWEDGQGAVIFNRYGKGNVLSLGGNLSLGFSNEWDSLSFKGIRRVLDILGIEVPEWAGSGLVVNKRSSKEEEYCFVFNYSDEKKILPLPGRDLLQIDAESATLHNNELTIDVGGVWVGKSSR